MRPLAIWPFLTAAFCAMFVALIALFNFWLDPYHLFRADNLYVKDSNHQRYVNAGIILTDPDFDALVVGTSYVANFNTATIDRLFGFRSRVLAVWGGPQKVVTETLRFALSRHPDLKAVFIGMSIWGSCGETDHPVWHFPAALYRGELRGYLPALLTRDPTILAAEKFLKITGLGKPSTEFTDKVAEVPRWEESEALLGSPERLREGLADADQDRVFSPTPEAIAASATAIAACVERNVLSLARQYPATRFHVFNPPTFQWWLWRWQRAGSVPIWNEAQALIAQAVAKMPNTNYYDFFAADEIVNDCTRFRDLGHFDSRSADDLAAMMRQGRYRRAPDSNDWISQRITANALEPVACPPNPAPQNAF